MFGLFNQDKLLPLRYHPIQIELELVNGFTDAIVIRDADDSALWDISDIQCKCDLLTLDNTLDNEYASHLLAGKSLPINLSTWSHTNQSTGADKKTFLLTSIGHYLVLNLYSLLLIRLTLLHTKKPIIFFIRLLSN